MAAEKLLNAQKTTSFQTLLTMIKHFFGLAKRGGTGLQELKMHANTFSEFLPYFESVKFAFPSCQSSIEDNPV